MLLHFYWHNGYSANPGNIGIASRTSRYSASPSNIAEALA